MALTEQTSPPRASHSSNIRFLAHCDQGGRPDGVQVMVHKGHAFVGHMFSDGFSVIDLRDPRKPRTVAFVAAPKNTRSHHLQISDDILLAVNGPNIWAMQQYASQADYYGRSLADSVTTEQPFGAGLRVFDVSQPEKPREIGFLHMPGFGAHRIWWSAGATPTFLCILTATSITPWRSSMFRIRESRRSPDIGGCPECIAPEARKSPFPSASARHCII